MICYTTVGVNDLPRALRFYQPLFAEMGLDQYGVDQISASWGRKGDPSVSRFSIGYPFEGPASVGNGTMTAFLIASPEMIDRQHAFVPYDAGEGA